MFKDLSKNQRKKTVLLHKKQVEQYFAGGFGSFQATSGYCSSFWINLFLLSGNVFAFAAAMQMVKAEMQHTHHSTYTSDATSHYSTTQNNLAFNLTDSEIREKVVLHPEMKGKLSLRSCQQMVTSSIQQTLFKYPLTREYIPQVIKQPDFKIECSSRQHIHEALTGTKNKPASSSFMGYFQSPQNKMVVTRLTPPSIYAHEFWHARQKQLHRNPPCRLPDNVQLYPYYPKTEAELERLMQAINKTYASALRCKKLLELEKKGLSKKQKEQLAKYKDAVADLKIEQITRPDAETVIAYEAWVKNKNQGPILVLSEGHELKVINMIEEEGEKFLLTEYVDSLQGWLMHLLEGIDNYLDKYHANSNEHVSVEIDAYLLQFATRKALLAFDGGDLLRLHDEHRQRCMPEELSSNEKEHSDESENIRFKFN
jgi:hypothetical protein